METKVSEPTTTERHNINGKENKVFWVVERYVNNRLCYWAVGARGRSSRDDWAEDISFAVRLADYPSAEAIMVHAAGGEGRCTAHMFASKVGKTPWEIEGRKPTIAELEAILASPEKQTIEIQPDGSIRAVPLQPNP